MQLQDKLTLKLSCTFFFFTKMIQRQRVIFRFFFSTNAALSR